MFRYKPRRMCMITCKKLMLLLGAGMISTTFFSYFLFFNHGPPEDIMSSNRYQKQSGRLFADQSDEHMDDIDKHIHGENKRAYDYWEDFIEKNKFVSIGEVYDNCEEGDRLLVGKTIMLPEVKWGGFKGVKSRTFINATLEEELTGGRFYLDVLYNETPIYSKDWELCTLDEDYQDPERIIYCPFNPGDYSFVKDRSIPIYLPSGRYRTKGRITNQNDEVILCGFSDFKL